MKTPEVQQELGSGLPRLRSSGPNGKVKWLERRVKGDGHGIQIYFRRERHEVGRSCE